MPPTVTESAGVNAEQGVVITQDGNRIALTEAQIEALFAVVIVRRVEGQGR